MEREFSAAQLEATKAGRPIYVATFLHLVHSCHGFDGSDGSHAAPLSESRDIIRPRNSRRSTRGGRG